MLGETLLLTSGLLVAVGVYGLLSTRSLIRMLLSVEVMFNGALLALLTLAGGAEGAARLEIRGGPQPCRRILEAWS